MIESTLYFLAIAFAIAPAFMPNGKALYISLALFIVAQIAMFPLMLYSLAKNDSAGDMGSSLGALVPLFVFIPSFLMSLLVRAIFRSIDKHEPPLPPNDELY